jgi:hypothetical protein
MPVSRSFGPSACCISASQAAHACCCAQVGVLEFSQDRKMMSVRARRGGKDTLFVKGAPENIFERCTEVSTCCRPSAPQQHLSQSYRCWIASLLREHPSCLGGIIVVQSMVVLVGAGANTQPLCPCLTGPCSDLASPTRGRMCGSRSTAACLQSAPYLHVGRRYFYI